MDQVEFANIIVLNKGDLVNKDQQADLEEKVAAINPHAKILKSIQSKINVKDILDTKLYKGKDQFLVTSSMAADHEEKEKERQEKLKKLEAEKGCTDACKKACACTEARFGIKSFVYQARKPFHPGRLVDLFLSPYFMDPVPAEDLDEGDEDDGEEEGEEEEETEKKEKKKPRVLTPEEEEEKKKLEEEIALKLEEMQKEAAVKQKARVKAFGEMLRSKGFIWFATSNVRLLP